METNLYQRLLFLGKESLLLTSVHRPGKNTAAIPCGFFAFNLGTEHIEYSYCRHIHNSVKLSNKRCIRPFILGKKKEKGDNALHTRVTLLLMMLKKLFSEY
jgi:hypothetical protein